MDEKDSRKPPIPPTSSSGLHAGSRFNSTPPPPGVPLEPDLQAHIGRQLRQVYDDVVKEDIPDRFMKLLEELERKQGSPS